MSHFLPKDIPAQEISILALSNLPFARLECAACGSSFLDQDLTCHRRPPLDSSADPEQDKRQTTFDGPSPNSNLYLPFMMHTPTTVPSVADTLVPATIQHHETDTNQHPLNRREPQCCHCGWRGGHAVIAEPVASCALDGKSRAKWTDLHPIFEVLLYFYNGFGTSVGPYGLATESALSFR
ncbi:hypothetical protein B0H19DRAFT_1062820 [Mycena capillaripes]|nr:hypothetical protein B0H19DRAFT_1062820 [Mycena capillaripes]